MSETNAASRAAEPTVTENDAIRARVRAQYRDVADGVAKAPTSSCCASGPTASLALGYTQADLDAVPQGANMGLGCGNPTALAALRPGEVVLDLGSGGGFDSFLAARQVGEEGRVIGVDMTPAMVSKARNNAATLGLAHVDFRLGEIEHLPVPDAHVDVILSNCVINLSPDKAQVFREAFRVLAPGGRLAISDIVALRAMPDALRKDAEALVGCIAGAITVAELETRLEEAGFASVAIDVDASSREFIKDWIPGSGAEDYVASARITATKAGARRVAAASEDSVAPGGATTGCC
ncbi:MAG: arsenite methyltransferase [Myxococcota bacterium]